MESSFALADKICDQVSDAVLDAHLKQDPNAKVACGEFSLSVLLVELSLGSGDASFPKKRKERHLTKNLLSSQHSANPVASLISFKCRVVLFALQ